MGRGTATGSARFNDVVTSVAMLREVVPDPDELVKQKVISIVDETAARFIAASPFLLIATTDASGTLDVSPKGDPAGFVKVLDEKTVAIPDRLGNGRLDTLRNILANPNVGLIFLIPGAGHTLRVSGRATVVRDRAVREELAFKGKLPDHAIVVDVDRVLSHCTKCMIRSGLWNEEKWPDTANVPSLTDILVAHAKLEAAAKADLQKRIDTDISERLY